MFHIAPSRSWSIRWRLTAWYAASSLFILSIAGAAAYYAFRSTFIRQTDRSLTIRGMEVISSAVRDELFRRNQRFIQPASDPKAVIANVEAQFSTDSASPVGDPVYMRLLQTSPRQIVLLSHNVKRHDFVQQLLGKSIALTRDETVDGYFAGSGEYEELRVVEIRVPRQPFVLQLATPWQRYQDALAPVVNTIVCVVGIGFLLSAVGGSILVGRTLRPISEIVTEAEKTTGYQLEPAFVAARTRTDDEIGHLASALNDMMGRVHRAIASQRQFTADASHDLRTPLTIIRGEIELALSRERSLEEYREVLASALEETDRLIRIVNDLGELASADEKTEHRRHCKTIDIRTLCRNVAQSRRPQATAREVNILMTDGGSSSEAPLYCDEMALERAIGNLLDNAINYNSPGGTVVIRVINLDDDVKVEVADNGHGITAEDVAHIFDRFYRGDKARSAIGGSGSSHSGLGLAIVKSVVTAHGGEIDVDTSTNTGSKFTVTLPKSKR